MSIDFRIIVFESNNISNKFNSIKINFFKYNHTQYEHLQSSDFGNYMGNENYELTKFLNYDQKSHTHTHYGTKNGIHSVIKAHLKRMINKKIIHARGIKC